MNQNIPLRLARMNAGWTQEGLAAELNVSSMTIYRWEQGQRFPGAFHRARLCTALHTSAEELGWTTFSGREQQASSGDRVVCDPLVPVSTTPLVGQRALLQTMQARCQTGTHRTLSLVGMTGSGKTALAAALASQLLRHQETGVLWASPGPEPSTPRRHLQRWALLLGLQTLPDDLEEARDRIRVAIGARQVLLVLDDVWSEEALAWYQVGGPYCRYLLTTPLSSLAQRCSEWVAHPQPLDTAQALTLLKRGLPAAFVQRYRSALLEIIAQVGASPLALSAIGAHLREVATSDSPRRNREVLTQMSQSTSYLHLRAPGYGSVASSLKHEEQRLSASACRALHCLALHFPSAPAPFSERQVHALFQSRGLQLRDLDQAVDHHLIQALGKGLYQMPPVVAHYFSSFRKERSATSGQRVTP